MIPGALPRRVRAWYGLPGEIVIDGDQWHLVKVGPLPLPHPPLVNRFIRRGLPPEARLALSYRHELGHLQTLPLALAHAFWLWRRLPGPHRETSALRLVRLVSGLIAHESVWELAAESYVIAGSGARYWRIYRGQSKRRLALFWGGMTGLALLGTLLVTRKGRGGS